MDSESRFVSVIELISKGYQAEALASVIENQSVYTWDRFGRYIVADSGDGETSVKNLLDQLAKYFELSSAYRPEHPSMEYPDELRELEDQAVSPLQRFGWRDQDLPNIERIYEQWLTEHHGDTQVPSINVSDPPNQSGVWGFVKFLLVEKFTLEEIEECTEPYSRKAGELARILENEGYSISGDLLKTYLSKSL